MMAAAAARSLIRIGVSVPMSATESSNRAGRISTYPNFDEINIAIGNTGQGVACL